MTDTDHVTGIPVGALSYCKHCSRPIVLLSWLLGNYWFHEADPDPNVAEGVYRDCRKPSTGRDLGRIYKANPQLCVSHGYRHRSVKVRPNYIPERECSCTYDSTGDPLAAEAPLPVPPRPDFEDHPPQYVRTVDDGAHRRRGYVVEQGGKGVRTPVRLVGKVGTADLWLSVDPDDSNKQREAEAKRAERALGNAPVPPHVAAENGAGVSVHEQVARPDLLQKYAVYTSYLRLEGGSDAVQSIDEITNDAAAMVRQRGEQMVSTRLVRLAPDLVLVVTTALEQEPVTEESPS